MELQQVSFDDEITLYWDYIDLKETGGHYEAFLNGALWRRFDRTHVEFTGLTPKTAYAVRVVLTDDAGRALQTIADGVYTTRASKRRLDVSGAPYFAKGDGVTLNTAALQKALDDCRPDECVYFPAGTYLSGALKLHSDTEIYLSPDAVLLGSERYEDYLPKIRSRFEGIEMECYASLLNMGDMQAHGPINCRNVVVRGGGRISGGGAALCENEIARERVLLKEYIASLGEKAKECENEDTIPGRPRGRLVHIANCENVVLCHVTMENAPAWNIHMIYSDRILTYACEINSLGIHNGDGWDPDSSSHCTLFGSVFNTGDNAIAVKSGKNPDGNRVNIPATEIRVFDVESHRGGGCVVGSEMSGGVSEVYFWDCDFRRCSPGLQLKGTAKRGGYIRNVEIRNCRTSTLWVSSAVGYNNDGEAAPTVPYFENYLFEDIEVEGTVLYKEKLCKTKALVLTGFAEEGHELKNVCLRRVTILPSPDANPQTAEIEHAKDLHFENVTFL